MGYAEAQYIIDEILKGMATTNIIVNMTEARLVVRSDIPEDEGKTVAITDGEQTWNQAINGNLYAVFDLPGKQRYDLKVKNIKPDGNFTVEFHTTIDLSAGEYKDIMVGLRTDTWQGLQNILNVGLTRKYIQVGHEMKVNLETGDEMVFQVASINHENTNDIIFVSKACLPETRASHSTAAYPTTVKFDKSDLSVFLNNTFFNSLPEDLKRVIKERTFKTAIGQMDTGLVENRCKIWIPRIYEVTGTKMNYSFATEDATCKQFPIFPTTASRIKNLGLTGAATNWITCSPCHYANSGGYVNGFKHSGVYNEELIIYSAKTGILPCFIMKADS